MTRRLPGLSTVQLLCRYGQTVAAGQAGDIMFVPQRPYMVLGSLREQVLYPTWATSDPSQPSSDPSNVPSDSNQASSDAHNDSNRCASLTVCWNQLTLYTAIQMPCHALQ